MRINDNKISTNTTISTEQAQQITKSESARIGEYLAPQTSQEDNKTYGKSADISISDSEKSDIIGFAQKKINIVTKDGKEFSINLFIQGNTPPEQAQKLTEKLTKAIANLPPKTLDDMQKEMKHITICPDIIVNKKALALAVAPLNQIYLSANMLAECSEAEIANTLIHEQGHLVDRMEGMFAGNFSKYFKKDFSELKDVLSLDSSINTSEHTFSKVSELFADYYLFKNRTEEKTHRAIEIFNKLETYKDDFQNLTEIELLAIYKENVDIVKNIAKKWGQMSEEFDQYMRRLNEGDWKRMNENIAPMSVEQIIERNERILSSETK